MPISIDVLHILTTSIHFIYSRELLDNLIAQKQQKPVSAEHSQLVELVLQKDTDLKATLKVHTILFHAHSFFK